ncbi:MAG TPA: RNA polymerase sigma factor [Candidatus Hydrogenedentes bacterium]|nr:RNA polymerase sigma factor [Candidatus Hydrogenedentota bacterium]
MESDHELMRRIIERDAGAFEELFARHNRAVFAHLTHIVRDKTAAEDLAQEVFLRVWTRSGQWRGKGPFRAWLMRVATNLALNYLRTVRRRKQQPLEARAGFADEEDENPAPGWLIDAATLGPDAAAEQLEQFERLRGLVEELPESKREVIRLFYDAEMDIHEAADTLGIPEGTVKSRLHHARSRLARKWTKLENGIEDRGERQ